MNKRHGILLAMAALGLFFAGCNKATGAGADALGDVTGETIVGKWYVRHLVEHGTISNHVTVPKDTTLVTHIDKDTVITSNDYYMEIKADGSVSTNVPTVAKVAAKVAAVNLYISSGTWTLSGHTLKTVYGTDTTTSEVGISGGQLTTVSHVNKTTVSPYTTIIYDMNTTTTFGK